MPSDSYENKPLSPKRQRFVEEYLKDLNGTQAAIRAGYSANTANEQAARLLADDSVRAEVDRLQAEKTRELKIEAKEVLAELHKLSYVSPKDIFDERGRLYNINDMPDEVAAAISGFKVVTKTLPIKGGPVEIEYITEIKFWDKRGSLELLGKHLKLFTDKTEISVPGGVPLTMTILEASNKLASIIRTAKQRKAEAGDGKP